MIESNVKAKHLTALFCWTIGLLNMSPIPRLFLKGNPLDTIISLLVVTATVGLPLTLLELSISQYSRKSISGCWDLCPFFRGIGYTKVILLFLIQIYTNVLNSYSLFYCFSSIPQHARGNLTEQEEKFWYEEVMDMTGTSAGIGEPNWKLVGCLCATMAVVFLANHTPSVQNFLPIAFTISCAETVLLLVFILTTPGSLHGINDFISSGVDVNTFVPWRKDAKILEVFQSTLFSLGIGLGGLSGIAARNNFRYPVHSSAIWVCLINFATTILTVLQMACIYGIISQNTNTDIGTIKLEVLQAKTEISYLFTTVPKALRFIPGFTHAWQFVFYSNTFIKGVACSVFMASIILQEIYELKPQLISRSILCSIIYSVFTCLSGSIFLTNAGATLENFFFRISYTTIIPLFNSLEIIAITLFYGVMRFQDDYQFMLGFSLPTYYQITLVMNTFLIPMFTIISMVCYFQEPLGSQPSLIIILQKTLLSILLVWIPFMALVRIIRKRDVKKLFLPSRNWGPPESLKNSRNLFDNQYSIEECLYEKYLLPNKLKKYE